MYLEHYRLKLMPFEIGPDPKFLWLGEKHEEALAILKYGILENKGFIVLIGEPGTGKSTLLNAIIGNFGSSVRFAKIADPALNEMDFFNFAANAFGMGRTFDSKAEFLIHLQQFISDTAARSEKVVLVIDEAQRLTPELLEQIRVLPNFEGPSKKVISCIFAGQSEFLEMVKHNPSMSQRVFFSHLIQPLTEAETGDYIAHRLKVAGAADAIFGASAIREIFRLSGGNPRLINIICDQALLSGYATFLKVIGLDIIRKCTQDTLIPFEATPKLKAVHDDRVSQAGIDPKEGAADALADPDPRLPAHTPSVSNHKASYFALAAVLILMGVVYGFFSGAFNTLRQEKLESPASNQVSLKEEMDAIKKENTRLQAQLVEVTNQKGAAEARLGEAQNQNTGLVADAKDVKIARNLVAQLETAKSERDKKLIQLEQELRELEKALTNEKDVKKQMNAELSSRQKAIADLQKLIETVRAEQLKLETEMQNAQRENIRLQSRFRELKAAKPPPPPVSFDTDGAGPDPARVIDFVIKKKSQ